MSRVTSKLSRGSQAVTAEERDVRSRSKLKGAIVCTAAATVGALAVSAWGYSPPALAAACGSSTPISQSFADAANDEVDANGNADPLRYAPDIISVDVRVDARCNITVGATLGDHLTSPDSLFTGEIIAFLLDTDGNPGTGSGGSDRALVTYGDRFGPDQTRVGSWTGNAFSFQDMPNPATPWGQQTVTLDALGITSPTTVSIRTFAELSLPDGTQGYDFAPDGAVSVAFTGQPGPGGQPGADGQPGAGSPPATSDPARPACTVPRVRGMRVSQAKRKLAAAGCRARVARASSRKVRRGRVIKTSPRAGQSASARVTVTVSRGRR